jgi:acetylornithine deacetylase/succinyl-diaminopimelate desuccinylase-like protein
MAHQLSTQELGQTVAHLVERNEELELENAALKKQLQTVLAEQLKKDLGAILDAKRLKDEAECEKGDAHRMETKQLIQTMEEKLQKELEEFGEKLQKEKAALEKQLQAFSEYNVRFKSQLEQENATFKKTVVEEYARFMHQIEQKNAISANRLEEKLKKDLKVALDEKDKVFVAVYFIFLGKFSAFL